MAFLLFGCGARGNPWYALLKRKRDASPSVKRPNVILVMTDDQGYGDLGCTGNPWIQTPHIDAFHADAVRLADFHVSPLCTPTRGALLTGPRPIRNGAWATCWGRSILRKTEVTLADAFSANGYRTGMFGKWHPGDNYPYRPQDRGFQHVVAHKGGGVGQTPDFWGNNYFDDTYFHNGAPVAGRTGSPHRRICVCGRRGQPHLRTRRRGLHPHRADPCAAGIVRT
jgi:arylsulfatase A-like enzyme